LDFLQHLVFSKSDQTKIIGFLQCQLHLFDKFFVKYYGII